MATTKNIEISEASWQKMVIQLAVSKGWKYYHPPDNIPNKAGKRQYVVAGYPDLTLVKDNRLLFIELKRNLGKTTKEQVEWLEALKKAGAEVYVWRPKDYNEVVQVLSR